MFGAVMSGMAIGNANGLTQVRFLWAFFRQGTFMFGCVGCVVVRQGDAWFIKQERFLPGSIPGLVLWFGTA